MQNRIYAAPAVKGLRIQIFLLFVVDLSKHLVMNYEDIKELIDKGNSTRYRLHTLCRNI